MFIEFLTAVFQQHRSDDAIVWKDQAYRYGWLLSKMGSWRERMRAENLAPGTVTVLEGDFSPNAVALFLVLLEEECVLVPISRTVEAKKRECIEVSQAQAAISVDLDDQVTFRRLDGQGRHPLYDRLRARRRPGLVLFSSGSTGPSKAAVHDLATLLEKFRVRRHRLRAISFLLYDHIGGVNTMLYTLSNAGCLVTVGQRSPDAVLHAVEKHRVNLLPTSPTFMNLILLSEAYRRHDLRSLEMVTYGTEPMPESTLRRFHELFPEIRLVQTYGLSEVGILRSKSRSCDSLWMKIGGEGFQTRVVDGILQIKAKSAMLGYLNAPSPFAEGGWLITGDRVQRDGEYVRILGRQSEMINVGGEKVFPAEVESVIQEMDNVAEVSVHGEKNAITGQIVCARVTLREDEPTKAFTLRLKRFCQERLKPFQVPVRVTTTRQPQHGDRFKRVRRAG